MNFFKNILNKKLKDTIFYKDFNGNIDNIKELEQLLAKENNATIKEKIQYELKIFKKGEQGEQAVARELKTSYLPMICLHDIRIELNKDEIAQIDFVLLTHKFIMLLEVKNLSSPNIIINENGEFIYKSTFKNTNLNGMSSPFEQNNRHVRVLRKFLQQNKLLKSVDIYSEVILTNCDTIIDRSKAPQDTKTRIHKIESLTKVIENQLLTHKNNPDIPKSKIINCAELLISNNKPIIINYRKKFGLKNTIINKKRNLIYILANKINDEVFIGSRNTNLTENELLEDLKIRSTGNNSFSKAIQLVGVNNIYIKEIREIPILNEEEKKELTIKILLELNKKSMVKYQNDWVKMSK